MRNWTLSNLDGLIPIFGGIYGYLLANGTLPRVPKKPEEMEIWRKKFGPMMKIAGPIIVFFGILQLLGIL